MVDVLYGVSDGSGHYRSIDNGCLTPIMRRPLEAGVMAF